MFSFLNPSALDNLKKEMYSECIKKGNCQKEGTTTIHLPESLVKEHQEQLTQEAELRIEQEKLDRRRDVILANSKVFWNKIHDLYPEIAGLEFKHITRDSKIMYCANCESNNCMMRLAAEKMKKITGLDFQSDIDNLPFNF